MNKSENLLTRASTSSMTSRLSTKSCDKSTALFASISEVNVAINLFFDNKFDEAKKLTSDKASSSVYHSLGYSTLLFLEAALTFEAEDINRAIESIKQSILVCNTFRKKKTVTSQVSKIFGLTSSDLSEEEQHAELIFAELNLYRAALTFVQDENLISFIRGALKIRMCYQTYNYCQKISDKLKSTERNMQFIGGVLFGCGFFNVSLSLLPPRILSLLEWFGFTADKGKGMQQLLNSYYSPNLRSSTISLFILSYNLFLSVHLGTHDSNLQLASTILKEMFNKYPNCIFFYLFAARLEELKGNIDVAIEYLIKATEIQSQWRQFMHICYWELMWCHAFKMEWQKSADYAEILRLESNWSKLVYTYLRAIFLYQSDRVTYLNEIDSLLSQVPSLQQRLAGKSLPTEKFLLRKSRKYFEQGHFLLLPAHEMMYCWSGLAMLKENSDLRKTHLDLVNRTFEKLGERSVASGVNLTAPCVHKSFNQIDDYCLLQLLKGTLLNYNTEASRAELCLLDVKENYPGIVRDHYLVPAALSDLVWIMIDQKRYDEALKLLNYTRKTYTNYSLESRFHFRMHAAQSYLDQVKTS